VNGVLVGVAGGVTQQEEVPGEERQIGYTRHVLGKNWVREEGQENEQDSHVIFS